MSGGAVAPFTRLAPQARSRSVQAELKTPSDDARSSHGLAYAKAPS